MNPLHRGVGLAIGASTPLLPAWFGLHALHPRLRGDLATRFGAATIAAEVGSVWIVAASVGEVGVAAALLPHLDGPVFLTADTDTGVDAALRAAAPYPRVVAQARPVDHPWTLAPAWAEARPSAVVLVEGAWWPALVGRALRDGIPVLAVQARAGRTARRWPPVWGAMVRSWTAAVARDAAAAATLEAAGATVVGIADLKADRPVPRPPIHGVEGAIVGMSTRPGDEVALLDAWMGAGRSRRLVLAPRHPQRFEAVWRLLHARGLAAQRRTDLVGECVESDVEVLLLDSLGELAGVVSVADAAFVGGTMSPRIGGHSPADALLAGVPAFAGPHTDSHPEAFSDVIVGDDLAAGLRSALARGRREARPSRAGARTVSALAPWLGGAPARPRSPRPWMLPAAATVRVATAARNLAYDRGLAPVHQVPVPVVAVGSANARGAGKTAAAAWAARHLQAAGHRVGIAVRGHGRAQLGGSSRGVRCSTAGLDARDLGDEGVRLAMAGFVVAASPDRVGAARALVAEGCTAVVLDDGLQHRRLHRDLDLVVVDGAHPTGRGPLPAGEAREDAVPARTDAVLWIDGTPDTEIRPPVSVLRRTPGPWVPRAPSGRVRILVGVGAPGRAVATLREGVDAERVVLVPDHAPIADRVRRWLDEGVCVATTAKDAARLPAALRVRVHYREVLVEGPWPTGVALPYDGVVGTGGGSSGA